MVKRCKPLLGTLVEVSCTAKETATELAACTAAFAAVQRVHTLMSYQSFDSELYAFNALSHMQYAQAATELIAVLQFCNGLSAASGGVFDVTAGPRNQAWLEHQACPTHSTHSAHKSAAAMPVNALSGRWQDIEIDAPNQRLRKLAPLQIDLSGVAKGYAVDVAVHAMQAAGATSGHLNAGGDCRVFGNTQRLVKVRAPWDLAYTIDLPALHNASLATSASYFLDVPVMAHGITGELVNPNISVTVVAPSCMAADALTKIVALTQNSEHPVLAAYGATAWLLKEPPCEDTRLGATTISSTRLDKTTPNELAPHKTKTVHSKTALIKATASEATHA